MMLVLIFAINLRWFSAGGFPGWENGFLGRHEGTDAARHRLALPQAAILARVMRSSLLDMLGEDFMRTARAKGLSRRQALWQHGVRNALIPVSDDHRPAILVPAGGRDHHRAGLFPARPWTAGFPEHQPRDLIVVEVVVMLLVFAVICVNFWSIWPMPPLTRACGPTA